MNSPKPSDRYRNLVDQYASMHINGKQDDGIDASDMFSGCALLPHIEKIKLNLQKRNCKSILDYGCGKASLYKAARIKLKTGMEIGTLKEYWGVDRVYLYDPAVSEYSTLPEETCDAVICTDVLEHCPESDIDWILEQIFSIATKFVYANIASYPAEKTLPNGENAHITIKPPAWWREKIEAASINSTADYLITIEEKRPRGVLGRFKLPFFKGVSRVYTTISRNINK